MTVSVNERPSSSRSSTGSTSRGAFPSHARSGSLLGARPHQGHAKSNERHARGVESQIPVKLSQRVSSLDDVMHLDDVVIDDAFDQVEEAPAEGQGTDQDVAGQLD